MILSHKQRKDYFYRLKRAGSLPQRNKSKLSDGRYYGYDFDFTFDYYWLLIEWERLKGERTPGRAGSCNLQQREPLWRIDTRPMTSVTYFCYGIRD
jgi:hypothetical protein